MVGEGRKKVQHCTKKPQGKTEDAYIWDDQLERAGTSSWGELNWASSSQRQPYSPRMVSNCPGHSLQDRQGSLRMTNANQEGAQICRKHQI
ncbi:unnamed protein product [Calypogeia fissa]